MSQRVAVHGSCFVAMPFAHEFSSVYNDAILPAIEGCRLRAHRADEEARPGAVFEQIREAIENSVACVADISGNNPNVFLELGLMQAAGKPIVLIARDRQLPFDVRNLRVHFYEATEGGLADLRDKLAKSLRSILGTDEQIVKELLVPASLRRDDTPFVIAASPLSWREAMKLGGGFKHLRQTSADHVGIRGLIQAFGALFGLRQLPELLNPNDYDDGAVNDRMHVFSIGSPKANRWTGLLLRDFYQQWAPRVEFKADPCSEDLRNVRVRIDHCGTVYAPPGYRPDANRRQWDFGLIVRGPRPDNQDCMFMVLAGRSALGTEAVCRAATDPECVREVKDQLNRLGVDLNNHTQPFWAVAHISGDEAGGKCEADLATLRIACVDRYQATGPK